MKKTRKAEKKADDSPAEITAIPFQFRTKSYTLYGAIMACKRAREAADAARPNRGRHRPRARVVNDIHRRIRRLYYYLWRRYRDQFIDTLKGYDNEGFATSDYLNYRPPLGELGIHFDVEILDLETLVSDLQPDLARQKNRPPTTSLLAKRQAFATWRQAECRRLLGILGIPSDSPLGYAARKILDHIKKNKTFKKIPSEETIKNDIKPLLTYRRRRKTPKS